MKHSARAQGPRRSSRSWSPSTIALYQAGVIPHLPDIENADRGSRAGARQVDLPVRRRPRLPRDGRRRRPRRPGRDGGDHRRCRRRPGRDLPDPPARHRLDLLRARRHHELLHRPPPRPRVPPSPRAEDQDRREAARAGRELLRPPRREDDPDRPLHRPRARAGAVRRRVVGLAYRRFIPFSIIGCGLWATCFTLLGYFFWHSFDKVAGIAGKATLVFASTVATVAVIVWLVRTLPRPRAARASDGVARPAGTAPAPAAGAPRSSGRCGVQPRRACGSCSTASRRATSGSSSPPRWPSAASASTSSSSTPSCSAATRR